MFTVCSCRRCRQTPSCELCTPDLWSPGNTNRPPDWCVGPDRWIKAWKSSADENYALRLQKERPNPYSNAAFCGGLFSSCGFNCGGKREQLSIITGAQLKQWHQFVHPYHFHENRAEWAAPPRRFHDMCGCTQEVADTRWVRTYGVICIQLRAVAEDLVGETVQVLDVVRKPWNWRTGRRKIQAFVWHKSHSKHFLIYL